MLAFYHTRISTAVSGTYAGAIVGFPISGLITHYVSWEYVYYVSSKPLAPHPQGCEQWKLSGVLTYTFPLLI